MAALALGLSSLGFFLIRRGWVWAAVAVVLVGVVALGVMFTIMRRERDSSDEAGKERKC
jgi:heme exporter protein D